MPEQEAEECAEIACENLPETDKVRDEWSILIYTLIKGVEVNTRDLVPQLDAVLRKKQFVYNSLTKFFSMSMTCLAFLPVRCGLMCLH